MSPSQRPFLLVCICIALLLGLLPAAPARAIGAIVVSSLKDSDNPNADSCTLREALQAIANAKSAGQPQSYHECASADPSINIITFGVVGTIKLNSTLPDITSNITLTGPAIIDGNNNVIFRVSADTAIFNFAALTLTKGNPALLVTATSPVINIAGSSFINNANDHGSGGAIDGRGKINIAGTNFTANSAVETGGAIYTSGTNVLNIAGSVFNGNVAKRSGGAVFTQAPANIVDTLFNGNIAKGEDPDHDGDDDAFDDYTGLGGGALYSANDGTDGRKLKLTRVVFNGNLSPKGNGGALFNASAAHTEIAQSSFNGNLAGTPPSTNRQGGAINNLNGKLTISGSVLLNNGVVGDGGGIANDRGGNLTLANVELTANAATGTGGGLRNVNTQQGSNIRPQATLLNSTFNLNVAPGGGGGIFNQNAPAAGLTLGNTIIAGSDGGGLGGNCAGGALTSQGHNLDSGTSCGLVGSADLNNADAKLQVPSLNGGPLAALLTQKIGAGSAAADAGDNAICAAEPVNNQDVRGSTRPKGATCDIGAFEATPAVAGYGSVPVQPGPLAIGSATVGTPVSANFSMFETGDATLLVGSAVISGAQASEFAITSGLPATLADGAAPQLVTLTCTPAAVGTRSATLTLATNDPAHTSVTYNLFCIGSAVPQAAFSATPAAPGPVDFGAVNIGQTQPGALNVQEAGNAPLAVNTLVLGGLNPGDFSFGAGVDLNLPDGQPPFAIALSCTPTAPGIRTATLTLNTNDPAKPTVLFNLVCQGVTPPAPVLAGPGASIGNALADGNSGPYGLAISPDGKHVYSADDGDSIVTVFGRNSTGDLVFQDSVVDGSGGANDLHGARMLLVSPDGKNVYVSAYNDNAITAFARNPENGVLTFIDRVREGDSYSFCLPPNPCPTLNALDGAYGLAISPDGRFIYASSTADHSIIVLNRDQTTGGIQLGFFNPPVQIYQNPPDLVGAYGITLSPDGTQLYATGYASNTLLVFNRNAVNGTLNFVETYSKAQIAGLEGVFRVTTSPDGAYVYAASYDTDSVTAFKRNPASGKLTHIATYTKGVDGVDGIDATTSVAVSPDGTYLFATGFNSNAVAVFERDTTSGLLTFVQVIARNAAGQPPLAGARDVVVTPDGRMIFVTGHNDNRVTAIPLSNPAPTLLSLAPASTQAGSAAFTLTVNGENFVPATRAQWNGADRPTLFVNSGKLQVQVSAAEVASTGTATVAVVNPAPGGGTSTMLPFTISAPNTNPVPSVVSLAPQGVDAGSPALILTVSGANFIASSQVQWNGVNRPTTFVSATTLQAQISAADLAQPGQAGVTVVSPAPGGGSSNAATFAIAAPGQNPPPTITRLAPTSANVGSIVGEWTLAIIGTNFVEGAQAQWNGVVRPTMFVSDGELRVGLSAADVLSAGTASIVVENPAPGGGTSNVATFTIGTAGDNAVPVLTGATAGAPSGDVTITLAGVGFVSGATVQWNDVGFTPTEVTPTQVTFTIPVAHYRTAAVSVINPGPGGGPSNEIIVTVIRLQVYLPLLER